MAYNRPATLNSGLVWVSFLSAGLAYLSLWIVTIPEWHLTISLITLGILAFKADSRLRQLAYILGVVVFLFLLQIIFSPGIRAMFLRSLQEGIVWSEWQYLLLALERFTLPLALVSGFHRELIKPAVLTRLTGLLYPLQWLGFSIKKFEMILILSLKFIPGLQREWQRFDQLQTYFVSKLPQRTLVQKLVYWQGVLKAMIAHTLHQSVITGDLLAIRGLPTVAVSPEFRELGLPALLWGLVGSGSWLLDPVLFLTWVVTTGWLLLTLISMKGGKLT